MSTQFVSRILLYWDSASEAVQTRGPFRHCCHPSIRPPIFYPNKFTPSTHKTSCCSALIGSRPQRHRDGLLSLPAAHCSLPTGSRENTHFQATRRA